MFSTTTFLDCPLLDFLCMTLVWTLITNPHALFINSRFDPSPVCCKGQRFWTCVADLSKQRNNNGWVQARRHFNKLNKQSPLGRKQGKKNKTKRGSARASGSPAVKNLWRGWNAEGGSGKAGVRELWRVLPWMR